MAEGPERVERAGGRSSILIVEDDQALASLIAQFLVQHGFQTSIEGDGIRAVKRIINERPSLVVLDLMLPGQDGFTVCRKVRPRFDGPILMLTARGDEPDEVTGLEVGADDYLAKPVKPRILLARLRALLRRRAGASSDAHPALAGQALEVGTLTINPVSRDVTVAGTKLSLTSAEFDLLWLLASHAGTPLDRDVMYRALRGESQQDFDRSIDLRVSRVRQKIARASGEKSVIETVRGIGYLYVKR